MKYLFIFLQNYFLSFEENELLDYNYYDFNCKKIIKLLIIIIIIYLLCIKNINFFNKNNIIEIDNNINQILYEDNLDFSKYKTNIKIIAIFYPEYIKKDISCFNNISINEWEIINNVKPLFNGHKQPRKPHKNIDFENKKELSILIKEQVKLAKNHGIYGFGIIYYWFSGKKFLDELINFFLQYEEEINFPFFLIWKNDKLELNYKQDKSIIIEQEFKINELLIFIKDIKKYLISKKYIKINGKSILGIYEPLKIPNLNYYLSNLRQIANENGIDKLYILGTIYNHNDTNYKKLFDGYYEIPPMNLNLNDFNKNKYYYFYTGFIYRNNNYYDNTNYFNVYRGIMLEWDNSPEIKKKPLIFNDYSPEKFYFIIKLIINWTINHHNKDDSFIFINAWNNWKEGSYLEPDQYLGYASLNALSKALFNISYHKNNYNLLNLKNNCKVAVQAHIYYEDLIQEIINKTNNIPIKYDLFLSTTNIEIKNKVTEYIKKYSNSNKYEIVIFSNRGRDILPLLTQLKNRIKHYKYLCHIHSKKSKKNPIIGIKWRSYLYNNLLGNFIIVSEILSDFEINDKLGFIYPETFYEIIGLSFILTKKTKKYMKYILKHLFTNVKLGNRLIFPAGNMFWARVTAIYQIFEINLNNKFVKENDQTNDTIMHGIERIWLYLVKLNGYYYKTIFKSYN